VYYRALLEVEKSFTFKHLKVGRPFNNQNISIKVLKAFTLCYVMITQRYASKPTFKTHRTIANAKKN